MLSVGDKILSKTVFFPRIAQSLLWGYKKYLEK